MSGSETAEISLCVDDFDVEILTSTKYPRLHPPRNKLREECCTFLKDESFTKLGADLRFQGVQQSIAVAMLEFFGEHDNGTGSCSLRCG